MIQQIRIPILLTLATFTVACSSMRHNETKVSPAMLARVSESNRKELVALRAEHAEFENDLRFAKNKVEVEKSRLQVAKQEVDIAEQEIEQARARVRTEKLSEGTTADAGVPNVLSSAKAHSSWAEAQVTYCEARVDLAKSRVEQARLRSDLIERRIDLQEAVAVNKVDDADDDVDLTSRRAAAAKLEDELAMQEIEVTSWRDKVRVRRERMGTLEADVPEEMRSSWAPVEIDDDDDQTRADNDKPMKKKN